MTKWDVYVNDEFFFRGLEASSMEAAVGKALRQLREKHGPLDGDRARDNAYTRIHVSRAGNVAESSDAALDHGDR